MEMGEQNNTNSVNTSPNTDSTNFIVGASSGRKNATAPELKEWHYFEFAKGLIYLIVIIIGILTVIAVAISCCPICNKESVDFIKNIIKTVLYPFATLMIGYIFGKGIPKMKSKRLK